MADSVRYHNLLIRQLEQFDIDPSTGVDADKLARLLQAVDATYRATQNDIKQLGTLLDTVDGANVYLNQSGAVRGINDRGQTYFGLTWPELNGMTLLDGVRIVDDHGVRLVTDDLSRDRRIERGRVYRSDGSSFIASISISTICPDRQTQGSVMLLLDVEDRVAEEQALHDARVEALVARRAERDMSLFLANMSHELRTPLNAVVGYSELLQDAAGPSERSDLSKVVNAGRHLTDLIGRILDLSKIQARAMEITLEPQDVVEVVKDALNTFRPVIERKGLTLTFEGPDALVWFTDETRLRQVVYNLLSNARKFTEVGTIAVSVTQAGGQVHIRVADTGIGIAPEAIHQVFEPFAQAEGRREDHLGGSGLGLTLSRQLCQLLGGDLALTSIVGEGSEFVATIGIPPDPVTQQSTPR